MARSHTVNAPCGLAFDLEGDVIGKGGGIHGYDFKFKIDTKSGACVSTMCNHAGRGDFDRYLSTTFLALSMLNPNISLPQIAKKPASHAEVSELPIIECQQHFKGVSGFLAFPSARPLTRINFNGTTLPVKQLPPASEDVVERYIILGDSAFQGKELIIYEQNNHLYPCFSEGMEVWSFGEIKRRDYPVVSPNELSKKFASASGDYIDKTPGGPQPHQIRIDPDKGLTIGFPKDSPSKCLITALADNEISFIGCLGDGPQCVSFKLTKEKASDVWSLTILNIETDEPIIQLSRRI
jgi:hypothetical protein